MNKSILRERRLWTQNTTCKGLEMMVIEDNVSRTWSTTWNNYVLSTELWDQITYRKKEHTLSANCQCRWKEFCFQHIVWYLRVIPFACQYKGCFPKDLGVSTTEPEVEDNFPQVQCFSINGHTFNTNSFSLRASFSLSFLSQN